MLNPVCFSKTYAARRLGAADLGEAYRLCRDNPRYYAFQGAEATPASVAEDARVLPPGKTAEDKYYLGFYDGEELVAVMDAIAGYPDAGTALIGLFMVKKSRQRRGVGAAIVRETSAYLAEAGFSRIRLGYVEGNGESAGFWTACGFTPTGERAERGKFAVVVLQKPLAK